jgi:hypothetical protein
VSWVDVSTEERLGEETKEQAKTMAQGTPVLLVGLKIDCTGELDIHPGVMNGR